MAGKDPRLFLRRLAGKQGQYFQAGRVVLAQGLGRLADLALAGQEHQHIARAFAMRFADRSDDGIVEIAVLQETRRAAPRVSWPLEGRAERSEVFGVGPILVERAVARLDGIESAGDLDDGRAVEVLAEAFGIQRGRGDDHLQIAPSRQHRLQVAKQKVDVERSLVRLVDQDRVVLAQERIGLRLGEQDAVGHQLDVAFRRSLVREADLVADITAQLGFKFLGDTRRGGARGDAPRLGVADQALEAATEFEADLRQLCRFARAGLAADDDDLVLLNRRRDLGAAHVDGQSFVIHDSRTRRPAGFRIELHVSRKQIPGLRAP